MMGINRGIVILINVCQRDAPSAFAASYKSLGIIESPANKVVIPLSLPIIVTVSLFSFILAWNAFAWPLLILTKDDWFPVTVSIYGFIREVGPNFNLLMAACVISILPILILYFFTQRLFLESISNFGLKE